MARSADLREDTGMRLRKIRVDSRIARRAAGMLLLIALGLGTAVEAASTIPEPLARITVTADPQSAYAITLQNPTWLLGGSKAAPCDQVNGEAAQPVTPFVMLPGNGGESGSAVRRGGRLQGADPGITRGKMGGDTLQHPSPAQVETIQMRQLPIGRIGHHGRR